MRPSPVLRKAAAAAWVPAAAGLGSACLVAVAACGGSGAAPGAAAAPSSTASRAAQVAKVSLNLTVTSGPGATPQHWTLRCEPAGGTHPDPAAACRALLRVKDPFAPIPRMCPMIPADQGAGQATITGTYFGQPVSRTLTQNSCAAARWAMLGEVFSPVH
jgi:hypothetical protein